MKFSRAVSRLKWLNGEKNNVYKTISVLVLRVLIRMWLETESVLFIPVHSPCSRLIGLNRSDYVLNHNPISTLRTRTETVFKKLIFSPFNHLTWLIARENFIKFIRRDRMFLCNLHQLWTAKLGMTRSLYSPLSSAEINE
jgi:hypothetical protein